MNWQELLKKARAQPGYADRKQRSCHELTNVNITFHNEYGRPLEMVRNLGWLFPNNEELESVFTAKHDQHLYTYTEHVQRQLPHLIELLKQNPLTRRAILYLTDEQHSQQEEHLPCLLHLWFKLQEKQLHMRVSARSIDLLIGLPANLYQCSVLAKQVAEQLNVELASVTFSIGSAHVFSDYDEELTRITSLKNSSTKN